MVVNGCWSEMSVVLGCVSEKLNISHPLLFIVGRCMNMKIKFQLGKFFLTCVSCSCPFRLEHGKCWAILKTLLLALMLCALWIVIPSVSMGSWARRSHVWPYAIIYLGPYTNEAN